MPQINEYEPLQDFKNLLETYWEESQEFPMPTFQIVNDPNEAVSHVDFQDGDYILLAADPGEQIRYRGNVTYIDRIYSFVCIILTNANRQRLMNHYKMIRAICLGKKHDFPNWQFIRLLSYREMVAESLNIWRGEMRGQLENHAVLADTL